MDSFAGDCAVSYNLDKKDSKCMQMLPCGLIAKGTLQSNFKKSVMFSNPLTDTVALILRLESLFSHKSRIGISTASRRQQAEKV